jgi:hypothetical protein
MNQGINNQGENRYGHDEDCPGRTMVLSMTWSRDSNGASIGANRTFVAYAERLAVGTAGGKTVAGDRAFGALGTGNGVKNEA